VAKLNGTKIRAAKPRVATRAARITILKTAAPIYQTGQYREWRAAVIARSSGHCQDKACADPMRSTRLFCDHVIELKDNGRPFDVENGVALCGSCHSRKTLAERARRMGRR
jgi:5-methylcytosine-specific restriction protein A